MRLRSINVALKTPFAEIGGFWEPNDTHRRAAWELYVELVTRIAVVRLDGKQLNLLLAVLRTVLICLVVPPLVFNRDQRGLHDMAAGTVTIKR